MFDERSEEFGLRRSEGMGSDSALEQAAALSRLGLILDLVEEHRAALAVGCAEAGLVVYECGFEKIGHVGTVYDGEAVRLPIGRKLGFGTAAGCWLRIALVCDIHYVVSAVHRKDNTLPVVGRVCSFNFEHGIRAQTAARIKRYLTVSCAGKVPAGIRIIG